MYWNTNSGYNIRNQSSYLGNWAAWSKTLTIWGQFNIYLIITVFQSPDTLQWQNDYLQGTGCEMYTETLSPTFTGMTFSQASE